MSICKTQDPFESLTELLTNSNWVKKNRYLHFRHPKVQVKNLSHFWLSIAAISQQWLGVQLPPCFWRIEQQNTSPETSHFFMQVQPYFHFIPKPTAAQIRPQTQTGPSSNARGVADLR